MRIDKDEDGRITQDNVRKIISLSASINKIIERDVGFFYMEVHLVQGPSTLYCIFPRVLINAKEDEENALENVSTGKLQKKKELLFAGGNNIPRTIHEVIALLASWLARWDNILFRKFIFGEADEAITIGY
ncbi:unnamed protein product [Lactuca virosa]|uniref:EF-hand domain-containing protein n=1 Tax=Lactuca virosa TaxID=75947 RepID=A0AAU9NB43_9ASTR|nr:unnamed protein product [Lactuca virosa]